MLEGEGSVWEELLKIRIFLSSYFWSLNLGKEKNVNFRFWRLNVECKVFLEYNHVTSICIGTEEAETNVFIKHERTTTITSLLFQKMRNVSDIKVFFKK